MSDEGLQPERTALAWRRTGLVSAVGALALMRAAVARGSLVITAFCMLSLVAAAATLFEGTRELSPRRATPDGTLPAPTLPHAATLTVLVVVLLAVSGLVLVLAG